MNLSQLLTHFKSELKDIYEEEEVKSIFSVAVEHLLNLNRSTLMMNWGKELSQEEEQQFYPVVGGLKAKKPIQYLLGEAYFYGATFKVTEAVLIPRPETEELVDWILEDNLINKTVIDFGTGSGCIAISLKKHGKAKEVTAVDISEAALEIAKENALALKADVNFIHADILTFNEAGQYDVIVSNPPYITGVEMAEMHQNVLAHEPHLALFVPDERPLLFYEAIADFAVSHLKEGGALFFEINEYLSEEMIKMLEDKGFVNIVLRNDMQGKPRMISAKCS